MMMSLRRGGGERQDYNVVHKLPHGDSPYVRAKHVQVKNIRFCDFVNGNRIYERVYVALVEKYG